MTGSSVSTMAREGIQRGFIESLAQGDFKHIFHELARTTEGGVC